ncbi:hypothetical protein C2845_PM05G17600 [Panicum miliaceum]|uniref:Uncharacterized protein n=1 Tax=Panicum miliaceum TaxID=4540 RepID=A0A3L6T1Q6_PANMI|nr:hypothetical protein C2845_PM05G17600 [Panicum miliaceum]
MAGEVLAAAAAAAAAPPASELAWSPSTMTDSDIEALVAQGLLSEKAISGWRSYFGEAFSSEDRTEKQGYVGCGRRRHLLASPGGKYPEAVFKDNFKKWAEEWFVVANPAPGLPPRTGLPPVLNARWEGEAHRGGDDGGGGAAG